MRRSMWSPYAAPLAARVGSGCVDRQPLNRHALIEHVLAHSVRRGQFTLKSGAVSSWFLDTKQTACRPEGLLLVADAALEVIPREANAIGGLTMGADPMAF